MSVHRRSANRRGLATHLGRLAAAIALAAGIFLAFQQTASAAPRDLPRWIEARLAEGAWADAARGYETLARALAVAHRPRLAAETWARAAEVHGRAGASAARTAALLESAWAYLAADDPVRARSRLRALPAEPAPALRVRRDLLLARADLLSGRPHRAAERASSVDGHPSALPSDRAFARLLLGEAVLATGNDPRRADETLRSAGEAFRALGDAPREHLARRLAAQALLLADEPIRAERALERALAAFPDAGAERLRTRAVLAHAWVEQDRLDEAEALLRDDLARVRSGNDAVLLAQQFWELGRLYARRGESTRAAGHLLRALELGAAADDGLRQAARLNDLAVVELERGRPEGARGVLEAALLRAHGRSQIGVARTAARNLRELGRIGGRPDRGAVARVAGDRETLDGIALAFTTAVALPDSAWARAPEAERDCASPVRTGACASPVD